METKQHAPKVIQIIGQQVSKEHKLKQLNVGPPSLVTQGHGGSVKEHLK